ncbi:levodione reductase [Dioscorea cayenensis subsp. rotundata]|uniref:Levodione reductase n=1 Tax=Dioscorea cayennensis subsp. rotundata TaxID=55577 RepID=A0AB40B8P8_DIOCR|nr:levodione reductase [Dioscorea cayenensis subsp. rotundata]XP_039123690.1 levodione reductase [Dioscorea cayenensis subsp. rotundata]
MERLGKKRVLITSNGDEISKGIVFHLAKWGCRLVLMGDESCLRSMVAEISSSLKEIEPIEVVGLNFEDDDEAVFDAAVDKAWNALGALDAFVNCYLYEGKICEPLLLTEREFKKTVKINYMAPWFLLKSVAKRMRDSKLGGSIVFLTTILGSERGLYQGAAAAGSCMAAVEQLTRISAMEIGKYNIRVNSISRGLHLGDAYPTSIGRDKAERSTEHVMPLQRWLNPKNDLASTVIYLICDDSRYMTGTSIFVDGAQSLVRPRMKSFL